MQASPSTGSTRPHCSSPKIESRLAEIFATRQGQEKTVFVQADAGLGYGTVAEVIDMARRADATSVGLITTRLAIEQ